MLRVGLTGGIACGKSHVLARLAFRGLPTLDLDRVAHELMAPGGPAYDGVVRAFGPAILAPDGTVDRKALGALVFADAAARARLNAIVHPKVRDEEARRAGVQAGRPRAIFVTDAALLIESGVHLRFDRLVVVHCAEAEQRRRLMARDGLDEASAQARIAAQMPVGEKRRFGHFDLDTTGSLEATAAAADGLAAALEALAATRQPRREVTLQRGLGCLVHGPASGPRGLRPEGLLAEIAAAKGPEMERIARLLEPPAQGPWYRAGAVGAGDPGPESLAGPLVLWALARRGPDPPFLAAAAASLARLTHTDPGRIADACLFALVLQDMAAAEGVPVDLEARAAGAVVLAERWGGAPPSSRLTAVFRAAAAHPRDVQAARAECGHEGDDSDLAGALVGMATGVPTSAAPARLVDHLRALGSVGD